MATLTDIQVSMAKLREEKQKCEFALETSEKQCIKYQDALDEAVVTEALYKNVIELYLKVANDRNASAKELLEDVLNNALQTVPLDKKYKAHLVESSTGRSLKELYIRLLDYDTNSERSLFTSTGTMVGQIMSFLMTAIVLKFSGKRRLMILDEAFSGLDAEKSLPIFAELVIALAENEGFQFIIVEHKPELSNVPGVFEYGLVKPNPTENELKIAYERVGGDDDRD